VNSALATSLANSSVLYHSYPFTGRGRQPFRCERGVVTWNLTWPRSSQQPLTAVLRTVPERACQAETVFLRVFTQRQRLALSPASCWWLNTVRRNAWIPLSLFGFTFITGMNVSGSVPHGFGLRMSSPWRLLKDAGRRDEVNRPVHVNREGERAVHLGGWPLISRGFEPGFITGHPAAHPAELRARRGSCRSAHPLAKASLTRFSLPEEFLP
jgi:hypothetical protein